MEVLESLVGAGNVELALLVAGIVYMVIEYVLGKTAIVKPNSVIEAVLEFLKTALEKLNIKK